MAVKPTLNETGKELLESDWRTPVYGTNCSCYTKSNMMKDRQPTSYVGAGIKKSQHEQRLLGLQIMQNILKWIFQY